MKTNKTKFAVGDTVSMLIGRIKRIGVLEEVREKSLFVRWEIAGNKIIRSWSWISSDWVSKKYPSIIQKDELLIK
ncbi:MAG: hypothetical protein EAZ86_26240 [Oscillatoriales cyanobacterium]|nr:MAG: hypothetical protein EAZ86_26240 [Oscillatoriales cyanobacterium]